MNLENVLLVSAILFAIGLYGALTRRNAIILLMSIELMFNAVNIAAVGFSRYTVPATLSGNPVEVTDDGDVLELGRHDRRTGDRNRDHGRNENNAWETLSDPHVDPFGDERWKRRLLHLLRGFQRLV